MVCTKHLSIYKLDSNFYGGDHVIGSFLIPTSVWYYYQFYIYETYVLCVERLSSYTDYKLILLFRMCTKGQKEEKGAT